MYSESLTPQAGAPGAASPLPGGRHWFCIKAKPKHEHIAAAHLHLCPEAEVFFPRIRFQRPFKGKKIQVTEPLFPGYLFARFELSRHLLQVRYAAGVQTIVHFGTHIPMVPDETMASLMAEFGAEEVREVNAEPEAGDTVEIVMGAFAGLKGLVTRVIPARQRVAVLLEFLGRQLTVEIPVELLLKKRPPRHLVAGRFNA
ncbi:MAG: transcriptional activator RfaH [Verrucomicrobiae bacterium]|nr:transcriptional activator RfaH [Verrucomicrobiae bacterium]